MLSKHRISAKKNNRGIGMDITIAPLIDIVFLLLIFFMLITRFMNPTISLDIPSSDSATPLDMRGVIISVSDTGEIYLNDEIVTLDKLESRLSDIKETSGIELLRIRSDKTVGIQRIIEILDIAKNLNLQNVAIETKRKSEND
ncbi:biopolymer transporter ExbD [bacterium]|nr:biopolymer transporter ExbD [bacterium]MBU1025183.1 biopolymer transporter ExbD [bacterium]